MVVDGGGSLRRALFGDNIAALAVQNGWAGVIIYGAIRDSEQVDGVINELCCVLIHLTGWIQSIAHE